MRILVLLCLFCTHLNGLESRLSAIESVVQPPLFVEPESVQLSPEEIIKAVRPILKRHLQSTNYDRIFPIVQFLDHYEQCKQTDPSVTPMQAYQSFAFQPLLPGSRGGACVSLTFDLHQALLPEWKGYMVAAQLPGEFQQVGFPKYAHAAVVIKYQNPSQRSDNGYILLESGFDIDEPLLLPSTGEPVFYKTEKKGVWKFFVEGETIVCELIDRKEELPHLPPDYFKMTYLTTRILNPIESSVMPMILADRRLSFLSRREDGTHRAHLNIELNKQRVIWDRGQERFDPIPFSQLTEKNWSFPKWFAEELYTSSEELTERVLRVIRNKAVLDALYVDYMSFLKETKGQGIAGDIDLARVHELIALVRGEG